MNVVLITSKIFTSNKKFNYTNIRSIYTPEQRFTQTLNTISSIRKKIPNSYIILIDNSMLPKEMKNLLSTKVDMLLNPYDDELLKHYTDNSDIKALGELSQIKYAIGFITKLEFKFVNLFKISGRYLLNDNFAFTKYDNRENIFKKATLNEFKQYHPNLTINEIIDSYYYTCFYKIHRSHLDQYIKAINESFDYFIKNKESKLNLENVLPKRIKYKTIDTLGITQYIAIFNKISII